MKKRFICIFLALACLAGGTAAFAEDNSGRSLVSVSYLTGPFLTSLTESIRSNLRAGLQGIYDDALERLDQLGQTYLSGPTGEPSAWVYSDTHRALSVKRGDVITLSPGSTALWYEGTATASAGLVDATGGADVAGGARLVSGHRYLNASEDTPVTVRILSDAAGLLLEGYWHLEESDEEATDFTDLIQETDWYYDGVFYVVERGLFNGVSATRFSPNSAMNRAMLAAVLHRLAGNPQATYSGEFSDVSHGQWYTASVAWAAQAGVVRGFGDGTFGTASDVTREQIATMLYRYASDYLGLDVSHTGELAAYRDSAQVSDWARVPMAWAVGAGIITGTDTGQLLPGTNASRAQVAIMLQRFEAWSS